MIPFLGQLSQPLVKCLCRQAYNAYRQALYSPIEAQNTILKKIIQQLSQTEYGCIHNIIGDERYIDYQSKIPIVSYDDILHFIQKSKRQNKIITSEVIQFFEYTSGSSGSKKQIPYTRSLRRSFTTAFKIWSYDCLQSNVNLKSGKTFISISPVPSSSQKEQSLIQDDSDYLQGPLKYLAKCFLVSQPNLYQLTQLCHFQHILALTLLAEETLEIISIWSPSYLLQLLDYIENNWMYLLQQIERGETHINGYDFYHKASNKRLKYLQSLSMPNNIAIIWPRLQLISSWEAAMSQKGANQLRALFPQVIFQGKGLMATEAPLTIPFGSQNYYLPLLQDIFYEFEDQHGNILLLHDLEQGKEYKLIISQLGGLYRYRMGDIVSVNSIYANTPSLLFQGRANVSDLVGEKLSERFVDNVLNQAPFNQAKHNILIPKLLPNSQGQYQLLTDHQPLEAQSNVLDQALSQSFHYKNARYLNQLAMPQIIYLSDLPDNLRNYYLNQGVKWGDQKSHHLLNKPIAHSVECSDHIF